MSTASKIALAFFVLIGLMLILKNPASSTGMMLAGEQGATGLVGAFGGNQAPQKGGVNFGGGKSVQFG